MSKFSAVLNAAKLQESSGRGQEATTTADRPTATMPRPVGRPSGKRTDPDFQQITAYVRKDTMRSVKIALLQEADPDEGPRETSELIEELLAEWLTART